MKQYKNEIGFYVGRHSEKVVALNKFSELTENEAVYVTADNELIVSDTPVGKALLLDDKPSATAYNLDGEWAELPVAKPAPTNEERIAVLETQVAELVKNSKSSTDAISGSKS